eukprot:955600_1
MYAMKLQEMGNITTNVIWVGIIVQLKNGDIIPNDLVEDLNFKATCVCNSSTWDLILHRKQVVDTVVHSPDDTLTFNFWNDEGLDVLCKNSRLSGNTLVNMSEKLSVGIGVVDLLLPDYVEWHVYYIVEKTDRADYLDYRLMGTPVCIHTLVRNFFNGKVTESEIFTVDISCLKNPGIIRITITFDIEKDKYSSIWTVSHVLDEVPENALAKSDSTEHENDYSDKSAQSAEIPCNANDNTLTEANAIQEKSYSNVEIPLDEEPSSNVNDNTLTVANAIEEKPYSNVEIALDEEPSSNVNEDATSTQLKIDGEEASTVQDYNLETPPKDSTLKSNSGNQSEVEVPQTTLVKTATAATVGTGITGCLVAGGTVVAVILNILSEGAVGDWFRHSASCKALTARFSACGALFVFVFGAVNKAIDPVKTICEGLDKALTEFSGLSLAEKIVVGVACVVFLVLVVGGYLFRKRIGKCLKCEKKRDYREDRWTPRGCDSYDSV